ncbi:hypothetical protein [Mycobacterium bohemicum]|nr:hypothetical protein [Mycobacterium bohemicum]MCV6969379.1 hypothetical protein [Mycobacterium bohemicum]
MARVYDDVESWSTGSGRAACARATRGRELDDNPAVADLGELVERGS